MEIVLTVLLIIQLVLVLLELFNNWSEFKRNIQQYKRSKFLRK